MKIIYKKNFEQEPTPLLFPYFEGGKALPEYLQKWYDELIENKIANHKANEHFRYFSFTENTPKETIIWSLGKKTESASAKVRNSLALAIKFIRNHPCPQIALAWSEDFNAYAREIGEALALANYSLEIHKTGEGKKEAEEKIIQKLTIVCAEMDRVAKYDFEEGLKIGLAVNFARHLINGPSNLIHPESFAQHAKDVASENGYKIEVFNTKDLEKMKMGALLGVNKGSQFQAQLVVMQYLPLGKRQDPLILIGKGITFDTGGLNLKPTAGIEDMKKDMSGAAVVLGVFKLLKELDIKQNVIGIMPLTDNAVDAKALKPTDIVTSYSGITIEINNTDAEGRLILADAISYAVKNLHPSSIIDIATLTGACMVALGDIYAGMLGNNDRLKERLKNAGNETDELVWELPIHENHRKAMKGHLTDLINADGSGLAGASTAAAFLEEFVEKNDWVHLDIAGPAIPKKLKDYDFNKSGTGYGVRLLTRFLQNLK